VVDGEKLGDGLVVGEMRDRCTHRKVAFEVVGV